MDNINTKARLLGRYLRKQRQHKNITLASLAHMTNISISQISRIESGLDSYRREFHASLYAIEMITKALDLNLSDVLLDSGYISSEEIISDSTNELILNLLSNQKIQKEYPVPLVQLNKKEIEEICKSIINVLEYYSLKYRNYK